MAQSITLTSSMRSNLSSLKSIQSQLDRTQDRLSTGKKVNSAIDNASNFYQARSLTNRASDLETLLDSMGQGIQTIQAASDGIDAVTSFVEQLKSVTESAFALDPTSATYEASIKSYQNQFVRIQNEIRTLVKDASYQGINLLSGGRLTVTFNETRSNRFIIQGEDIVAGMNISPADTWTATAIKESDKTTADTTIKVPAPTEDDADATEDATVTKGAVVYNVSDGKGGAATEALKYGGDYYSKADGTKIDMTDKVAEVKMVDSTVMSYADSVDEAINQISVAIDYLRNYATELGNNFSIIETRQNFTEALINVLETGSDNLVLADMNEESANYLALQTRQQLAINSLSLAASSAQSVLKLFG